MFEYAISTGPGTLHYYGVTFFTGLPSICFKAWSLLKDRNNGKVTIVIAPAWPNCRTGK